MRRLHLVASAALFAASLVVPTLAGAHIPPLPTPNPPDAITMAVLLHVPGFPMPPG